MEPELVEGVPTTALVARRAPHDVVLMPVQDVAMAKQRLEQLQRFCAEYLEESKDGGNDGGDYGVIPGAGKKKVLFKSGSEKLCDVYGLADRYRIISRIEDFATGLFDYVIECDLVRKTDDMFVGSGLGSCSSWEAKYRWRDGRRVCPQCGADAIIKGREEYGGGWLCFKKKDGCGAKYSDTDPAIVGQKVGRVENPDIIDTKNTVLKIAKKRAKIDAVIAVTRSSGIFTQDIEDVVEHGPAPDEDLRHASSPTQSPSAPSTGQTQETHEERIARVKREQAAKRAAAQSQPAPTPPPPSPATPVAAPAAPTATPSQAPPSSPAPAPAPAPAKPAPVESADGRVHITGINVRNGPMIVKDGVTKPSWGPLYVFSFSGKVKANDGALVADAISPDEGIVAQAEAARAAAHADPATGLLKPVVEAGKKKGSYLLVKFE